MTAHQPVFSERNRAAIDRVLNPPPLSSPRRWFVRIPALLDARGKPLWLSSNRRMHWAPEAHLKASWKEAGRIAAIQAHLKGLQVQRVHMLAVVHYPNSSRNRDAHNLMPTMKHIVDGITSTGFLPDDNDQHLIGPDMRAGECLARPAISLTITEETP